MRTLFVGRGKLSTRQADETMPTQDSVPRATLGLAAEFLVASELCRRGVYAQLTLGNQKRTDLLVLSATGRFARIEVKAKQGRVWPNCRGVSGRKAFLVFADFAGKSLEKRPDFYILTSAEADELDAPARRWACAE